MSMPDWHSLEIDAVADRLEVDPELGLAAAGAVERRARFGANLIPSGEQRSLWRIFFAQFCDLMILVLLAAALISGAVGELADTIVILIIVAMNAAIGTSQEYRAERAVDALRALAAPEARVRRDGRVMRFAAAELVPGDLVLLRAGDVVPADLRLIQAAGLQVDEAALTGESNVVVKQPEGICAAQQPLAERLNLAFKGTMVASGHGQGLVVATGAATELGRIAQLLQQAAEVKTPLQKRLAQLGKRLALVVLVIALIIFVSGVLRGEPLLLMFLTAISLAVAAVPEALPAVVSMSLALGARRMTRHQALVRTLPAVETLGSVTCICSDKTGTLTCNEMRVDLFLTAEGRRARIPADATDYPVWRQIGRVLALNSEVMLQAGEAPVGEATELALQAAAQEAGFDRALLEVYHPRCGEIPFDATRKCMTTLHRGEEGVSAYTKGAPEQVLGRCTRQQLADGVGKCDRDFWSHQAERLAADGYRVLALATRSFPTLPQPSDKTSIEEQLVLLGLVALIDPPREEAPRAVAACRRAGITPVLITGDHPGTARAIALRLGIATATDEVLTGAQLAALDAESLAARVGEIRIYARVTPEQKIRIVEALQARGEFVAMTGDGVNDAPALKQADIGVAMGRKGTEVAREAADMVLLDDNFATIVEAVRQGRGIYDNIRKFVRYILSTNAGEVWTLFIGPLIGLPVALLPLQILWINLVTDGLPGLALTAEPREANLMQRPPRPPRESLFAHGLWQHVVWVGLLISGLCVGLQWWALRQDLPHWQTLVFTLLTFCQLTHVLAIRSERESLFRIGICSNLPLLGAVLLTVLLQLLMIYAPFFNRIFRTDPLSFAELVTVSLLSLIIFAAVELEKWLIRHRGLYNRG